MLPKWQVLTLRCWLTMAPDGSFVVTGNPLGQLIVRPLDALSQAAGRVASGARRLEVPQHGARELVEIGLGVDEADDPVELLELSLLPAQQGLALAQLALQTASLTPGLDQDASLLEQLSQFSANCRDLVREVRLLCHGLYPPALENFGLVSALEHVLDQIRADGRLAGKKVKTSLIGRSAVDDRLDRCSLLDWQVLLPGDPGWEETFSGMPAGMIPQELSPAPDEFASGPSAPSAPKAAIPRIRAFLF